MRNWAGGDVSLPVYQADRLTPPQPLPNETSFVRREGVGSTRFSLCIKVFRHGGVKTPPYRARNLKRLTRPVGSIGGAGGVEPVTAGFFDERERD